MRILFLNQAFYPDVVSSAQHSADLASHLAAEGHDVHALVSERAYDDPSQTFPREETWKGVQIHRIPAGKLGKGARWRRALDFAFFLVCLSLRLLRLSRFDAVVALTTPPLIGFLGSLFVRLKGGKLVYWVMDLNPDQAIAAGWLKADSPFARAFSGMLRSTLQHSSRIVVLDRFMAGQLLHKGADRDRIEIVPPWSHDVAVHFDDEARQAFRHEHGLDGRFVVMYSGNHSPCHPLRTVLEAAEQLALREDIVFCFIGGGSEHSKVKRFAAEHGLSNIKCLPYQPIERIAGSLGAADLHVVVMGDPFVGLVHPCKIYNVLSLGIPVLYVGPSEGHIPDMIPVEAHSKWFYPAEHGEVEIIAAHIQSAAARRVLQDPEEKRLGASFSSSVLIGKLVQSIGSLAPENRVERTSATAVVTGSRESAAASANAKPGIPWNLIYVAAPLLLCYAVVLARMANTWAADQNMSYGFFVPLLVGYAVWQQRDALRSAKVSGNGLGLVLMLLGAAMLCIGPPRLDTFAFPTRVAFVFSVVGAIIFVRGFATLKILTYPLLLMLLMIPLPGFVLERITFPLQLLASQLAEKSLDLMGYSVLREGNILRVPGATLSVVEACSGLRSLLSLTFLGQAYVCLFDSRRWVRPAMALLVIPIAVFANGIRIVVNAIAASYRPDWLHGIFHESTGWVVFVVAFLCIVSFHASFDKLGRRLRRQPETC